MTPSSPHPQPPRSHLVVWALAAALYALAVVVRLGVLNAQVAANGGDLPFTRESALQWWMTREVAEHGALPSPTTDLQHPDTVDLRRLHSIGAEYVYAGVARALPDSMPLDQRVRWASVLVFCLAVPLLGLYARSLTGGSLAALAAAGFLAAVGTANVARSSGVELSRENLSLPLFFAFLWLEHGALATGDRRRACFAAVCGTLAVCAWDMVLYGLWLWFLARAWPALRRPAEREIAPGVLALGAGLLIASVLNPYLRAHGVWHSGLPYACLVLGAVAWTGAGRNAWARVSPFATLALLAGVGRLLDGGRYGHFASLVAAKLRYFNVKPADPSLLTFDQRMLWTPALNSSTWALTRDFFPWVWLAGLGGLIALLVAPHLRAQRHRLTPVGALLITLPVYLLFFRFHVFLSAWLCVLGGALAAALPAMRGFRFAAGAAVVLTACAGEAWHTYRKSDPLTREERMALEAQGRGAEAARAGGNPFTSLDPIAVRMQRELTDYLGREHRGEPVLANFGISGPILAYAGCPVLLHPKFETPDIRQRVHEYATFLFGEGEEGLRDWAEARGARWLVFSIGEFSQFGVDLQLRYMVNQLNPGPETLARKLEARVKDQLEQMSRRSSRLPWDHLRYFRLRWMNAKYAVFQIVSRRDEEMAREFLDMARLAARAGDWAAVKKRAESALRYDETVAEAFELRNRAVTQLEKGKP